MNTIALMVFACAAPTLVDRTGLGWDDKLAQTTIKRATLVCRERYHGCLVKLTRATPRDFQAICRRAE
jgi:hypothetical protein